MGCAPSQHVNPIDSALVQALHAAKKRRGKKDFTFNELLLKFSSMAGGFKKAREYFDRMDLNGDKLIDLDEFMAMVGRGARKAVAAATPTGRLQADLATRSLRRDRSTQHTASHSAPPHAPKTHGAAWRTHRRARSAGPARPQTHPFDSRAPTPTRFTSTPRRRRRASAWT